MPSVGFETAIPAIKRLLRLRPHGHRDSPTYFYSVVKQTK